MTYSRCHDLVLVGILNYIIVNCNNSERRLREASVLAHVWSVTEVSPGSQAGHTRPGAPTRRAELAYAPGTRLARVHSQARCSFGDANTTIIISEKLLILISLLV